MLNPRFARYAVVLASLAMVAAACEDKPATAPADGGAVVAYTSQAQNGLAGARVNIRPAVRVTGLTGAPLASRSVDFALTTGGGSLTGANAITNSNGVAQVGSWVLGGSPVVNGLTATVSGTGFTGNPVSFTATGFAAAFSIVIQNVGPPFTPAVQGAFDAATAKWQQIIYQEIPDEPQLNSPADQC